jgi:hypothetical protein
MILYDVLQPANEDGFRTPSSLRTLSMFRHSLVRFQTTEAIDLLAYRAQFSSVILLTF